MSAPKLIAFYLPQFHPIPENDAWWGKGSPNGATSFARGRSSRATNSRTCLQISGSTISACRKPAIEQAELARRHGIYGFCYYYYWFSGKRLLERPLDEVHRSGEPDFPFCICWANHPWNRRWDGTPDDVLMSLEYRPGDNQHFIRDVIPLFRDSRYIRVGDRPLLVVSRPQDITGIASWIAVWKDECAAAASRTSVPLPGRGRPARGSAQLRLRCRDRVSAARSCRVRCDDRYRGSRADRSSDASGTTCRARSGRSHGRCPPTLSSAVS